MNANFGTLETSGSSDSKILDSQLGEALNDINSSQKTFQDFKEASMQRSDVFQNYLSDSDAEYLDTFKNELLHHLALSIVVKESRQRYQKEQFDRLLISAQNRSLANKSNSLDTFCIEYVKVIEALIDQSHNYKCPKIHANYDDMGEQTIRPLNSTVFYFFFSADKYKRSVA